MKTVLYIHGMGGGEDSRIPNLLRTMMPDVNVVVRTNDFNPAVARSQIESWRRELNPDVVVGESMGANYALLQRDVPVVLVCPALGGPWQLGTFAFLARIPGVRALLHRIFPQREGRRQVFDFGYDTLKNFKPLYRDVRLSVEDRRLSSFPTYAFFGTRDAYRLNGVVLPGRFRRDFGADSCEFFKGPHHMPEKELGKVVDKIREYC